MISKFRIMTVLFQLLGTTEVTLPTMYELQNIEVKDGDTLNADILLPFDITLRNQNIRAADYDAPEISTHRQTVKVTPEEIKQGLIAKRFLSNKLLVSKVYIAQYKKNRDAYGRLLGVLFYEENGQKELVSKLMIENGFIRSQEKK